MSYDPSYRRPPPQDRWPNATPQEPWPAYSGAETYREAAGYRGHREIAGGYAGGGYQNGGYQGGSYQGQGGSYQGTAYQDGGYQDGGYQDSGADGNWNGNGYDRDNGYDRSYGYGGVAADYGDAWDGGYGGYGQQDDQGGYAGATNHYAGTDLAEYVEPTPTGALLIAPDTLQGLPFQSPARERAARGGLLVGAVTGLLAAAISIGAAMLAAAFVRPQASPVIAVGGALIDRTPSAVKNFAVAHFGENDKTMLLGGMYVAIAVLAMVIGCLARRNAAIGVGGIAAFGLLGAFVAISRPEARPTDVVPSVIGGLAGIAAFAWLAWAASPTEPKALAAPVRHARAGGHRRGW
ncbi:MAG TPA: hypothetical protein VIX15_17740 [Streptosporangiaceae bacterium]